MADRMPPPGLTVVIAHPKDGAAPPTGGKMPPPGMKAPMKDGMGGKASPEEAEVIRSDQHCINCKNYDPTSGDCSMVAGSFDPDDACSEYFEAIGDDEPNDDEANESPDDEMQGQMDGQQ